MKRKLSFLFLSALTIPFFMGSCSDDKEEQEVKPAADLVVDNSSVTLLQGDEITVGIISGNGDYYVKPFDESVATATVNGNKVTIKATENSELEENNRTETTVLVIDGRKKVAKIQVQVAKLWNLTVDTPEEGFDLFIGEKRLIKILTGNGDYQISVPEGADKYLEVGELSGQTFPVTAKFETETDHPIEITITDKKDKTVVIPIVVNIVDLTLKSNDAIFAEPDAESQYIAIEKDNGGYTFTYQVEGGEPTADATIVEASEDENLITLKPKARGDVKVIVTDQKGSEEVIAVKVNPYEIKLEGNATSLSLNGFEVSKEISISRGNGEYKLAELTDDNLKYLESATIDENGKLTVKAKWMGTTALTITDAAGQKMELPVTVNAVSSRLEHDRYLHIDIKKYAESLQGAWVKSVDKLTFEVIFYPTSSRSLQSFIGLEGVFLLRCESGKDTDLRFELATKKISADNDPRFRSKQIMGSDRQNNGKWYHVAIVYDGSQSKAKDAYTMYINGVKEELTPAGNYADAEPNHTLNLTDIGGTDHALLIGRSGENWRYGYCKVYQARMWKTVRTETEIKRDLCKLFTKEEANENQDLVGYWVLSKGTGETEKFENWGSGGEDLDGYVYRQAFGNEERSFEKSTLPATYNGSKSRFEPVECPHSY